MSSLVDMDKIGFSIFTGDIVNHASDNALSEEYVKFEEQNVFNAFNAEMKNKKGGIVSFLSLLPTSALFFIFYFIFILNTP